MRGGRFSRLGRKLASSAPERRDALERQGYSALESALALIDEGFELTRRGRRRQALERFAEVIRAYGEDDDAKLRLEVIQCRTWAGKLAGELGDTDQAHRYFDTALAQLGAIDDPSFEEAHCEALVAKGNCLDGESRHMEALAVYDRILTRSAAVSLSPVSLAYGLRRRAIVASYVGLRQRAIDACEDYCALLDGNNHPEIRVGRAIVDGIHAIEVGMSGREEQALDEYRALKSRFAPGEDPQIDRELRSADEAIVTLTQSLSG